MSARFLSRGLLTVSLLGASMLPLAAEDARDAEIRALREQLKALEARIQALEESRATPKQETAAKDLAAGGAPAAVAAPGTSAPPASLSPGATAPQAVTITSSDELSALRMHVLLQADSRWFLGDSVANNDAFVVRRARFYLEGTYRKFIDFLVAPDFAGFRSAVCVADRRCRFDAGKSFRPQRLAGKISRAAGN